MDFGINGKTAIICGASKGLGRACAAALAEEGVKVTLVARTADAVEKAAQEIGRATGTETVAVAADVTTDAGRAAVLAACPEPDILVNNAGGPPPGDWRSFEREDWHKATDANMLSAILLIRDVLPAMQRRKFGRIVNITSAMVKMPHEFLSLSTAARMGLTGFVSGIVPSLAKDGITINSLLPERFDTDRLTSNISKLAERNGISIEEQRAKQEAASPTGRFGRPEEFGATCAFLCSVPAGYISGQNILLDGGSYPGVF
ncbi:SDR family oxidoreductase [Marinibaculum pumilum]|uniref:SDR family oxidoreductase n=1 Tax=Marinibaculum pumilum TaxID=1766165 RepID=A0ABV7L284_9PROT